MTIGEIIRIFQIANEYSNSELAEKSLMSESMVSQLKSGEKKIDLSKIEVFARAFNVRASQIYLIYELSEEENWAFQKTLLEVLKLYVD